MTPMLEADSEIKVLERRTQARLQVSTPIRIEVRLHNRFYDATCSDLSWGGMLFHLDEPLPRAARVIRIEFPWIGQHKIRAEGHIQRNETLANGQSVAAARFNKFSPRGHMRFERLLRTLRKSKRPAAQSGPQALVQELRIDISNRKQLRRTLTGIAKGWQRVTLRAPLALDQSICMTLRGVGEIARMLPRLRLRARVTDVNEREDRDASGAQLFNVVLAIEHSLDPLQALKDEIVAQLDAEIAEG